MHPLTILSILIVCHSLLQCGSSEPLAPALYVFGDSLADTGNNNFLVTFAKANYAPYGVDFHGHGTDFPKGRATGRVTNGRNVADYLAEYLELPHTPPYLNKTHPDVLTGYNYASASCGIYNATGTSLGKCLNLGEQVGYFQETVETKLAPKFEDPTELSEYLAKSIFVICIGSNDYLITYFVNATNASATYNPEEFAELLIDGYSQNLQTLYDLGARKVLFVEVGALGCIPYSRSKKPFGEDECDEDKNQIASIFNDKLRLMIESSASNLPETYFTLAHVYNLSYDAFKNPSDYGLTNVTGQCCTTVETDGTPGPCKLYIPGINRPFCNNRREYFFWDGFHPSQAFNAVTAAKCVKDSSFCHPLSIEQLVQAGVETAMPLYSAA